MIEEELPIQSAESCVPPKHSKDVHNAAAHIHSDIEQCIAPPYPIGTHIQFRIPGVEKHLSICEGVVVNIQKHGTLIVQTNRKNRTTKGKAKMIVSVKNVLAILPPIEPGPTQQALTFPEEEN